MADNKDKGAHQGDATRGNMGGAGKQGGEQTGKMPPDKMGKDWEQSKDTGRQGGRRDESLDDKHKTADTGRMSDQHKDRDR